MKTSVEAPNTQNHLLNQTWEHMQQNWYWHNRICWNHKSTYQTKLDNTSKNIILEHKKFGIDFVFCKVWCKLSANTNNCT